MASRVAVPDGNSDHSKVAASASDLDTRFCTFREEVNLLLADSMRSFNKDVQEMLTEKDAHFQEFIGKFAQNMTDSTISLVKKSESKMRGHIDYPRD